MIKKISVFMIVFVVALSFIVPIHVSAKGRQYVDEKNILVDKTGELVNPALEDNIYPKFINDYRNRKTNVSIYYESSPNKRVSSNIQTGKAGGSIISSRTVTFETNISGDIEGLGISTTVSISSTKGYVLNVGANQRAYMGFRVYYRVETGINELYDINTGKVIRSSRYTVKVPEYGEYVLINY